MFGTALGAACMGIFHVVCEDLQKPPGKRRGWNERTPEIWTWGVIRCLLKAEKNDAKRIAPYCGLCRGLKLDAE